MCVIYLFLTGSSSSEAATISTESSESLPSSASSFYMIPGADERSDYASVSDDIFTLSDMNMPAPPPYSTDKPPAYTDIYPASTF